MSLSSLRFAFWCLLVGPGVWLPVGAAEPTEYEQYLLELINRARANPQAEVQRAVANSATRPGSFADLFTPFPGPASLNEGSPSVSGVVHIIPTTPKPPLAMNPVLIDVTRPYAAVCQANNTISHNFNGTNPTGRMTSGGFAPAVPVNDGLEVPAGSAQPYYPGRENVGQVLSPWPWSSIDYTGDRRREALEAMHHSFFVDGSVPGRGHRVTLMVRDFREIGVGVDFGSDPGGWQSAYAVMNLGHQESRGPFITGVVYRDLVPDGFYTPGKGEALGGLSVRIRESGTVTEVASTTTFGSGGYGVIVPPGRTYDVVISGPGVSRTIPGVVVATSNVKIDAVEPAASAGFEITSIARAGISTTITWSTTPGLNYRVAASPDLVIWAPIANSQQTATAATLSFVDSSAAAGGNRFYRIERL